MITTNIFPDAESIVDGVSLEFKTEYISLVNSGTYGPPALIAPAPRGGVDGVRAKPGEKVLYINLSVIPLFDSVREPDEDE